VLQEALASLHDSFVVLAKSPLIDEFALVERTADDWTRAEALTQALQDTLETMRLPEAHDRPDADFHILNERYGVVDEAWRRFEFSGSRPSMKEIAQTFNCSRRALYNRLDEALEMFARAFRREIVKH
jgi:AraC-like DNA-binding protein